MARAPQSGTGQPAANPLTQAAAQPTSVPAVPPAGPNANPLDLFPQVIFVSYPCMPIFSLFLLILLFKIFCCCCVLNFGPGEGGQFSRYLTCKYSMQSS